jgi:hypothetical protein
VLIVWAALLMLVPIGYALVFRAGAVAAGMLGALDFSPPSFLVTREVAGFSRGLVRFTHSWNAIWLLIASAVVAYLLHHGALTVFDRLDQFPSRRTRLPAPGTPFRVYASRAWCAVLALLVLLTATWTGTVVWLAASRAHGDATSYGWRGGLGLGEYLFASVVAALLVAYSRSGHGWLIVAMPVAALAGAVTNVFRVPRDLVFPAGSRALERIVTASGGGSLWAALFVGFPACLLGAYLVARGRPLQEQRL